MSGADAEGSEGRKCWDRVSKEDRVSRDRPQPGEVFTDEETGWSWSVTSDPVCPASGPGLVSIHWRQRIQATGWKMV